MTTEKIISLATIRAVLSNQFRITGLTAVEARELALLMRSGSLSAPIFAVEERTIGPSLGAENIRMGVRALGIGMLAVFVFMALYYQRFGWVANLVLLANVVLLTALLSMLRATLSLPGIAGIILTVGIAVDANVLIYERIREELRNGVTPQAAIRAGFDKAYSAIFDSNVTALIAGLVLWVIGRGAIRGFAVVLTLGIATSMFTSLLGSRALITLMYGGRRKVEPPFDRLRSRHSGILQESHELSLHVDAQALVRAVAGAGRYRHRFVLRARPQSRGRLYRRRAGAGELQQCREHRRAARRTGTRRLPRGAGAVSGILAPGGDPPAAADLARAAM